jgi:hypothetical protein
MAAFKSTSSKPIGLKDQSTVYDFSNFVIHDISLNVDPVPI